MTNLVSGALFKKMVRNGAINLKNNYKEVNRINVFPVRDGDTGTNMQMTMMSGLKEIDNVDHDSIVDVSKILSRGLLMGARGNSGVILSQFFRGLYDEIQTINNEELNVDNFIQALVSGYEMAYSAVMNPVEGTMLTVVREAAEGVVRERSKIESIDDVINTYLKNAKKSLSNTPELLEVLKKAKVVDSGGYGFIKIIEGFAMALEGEDVIDNSNHDGLIEVTHNDINTIEDIKYGYCTEFIIKLHNPNKFKRNSIEKSLVRMGDSIVIVVDEEMLKVHIHTDEPGKVLTLSQKYGDIQTTKIENMRIQYSELSKK